MPRPRVTLPAPLDGRAFTVRQAREAGLGAGRLRSADLHAPLHGLRAPADAAGLGQLPLLAAGVADLLPGDVAFSHCTAAALWGMPLPRLREHALPLHVMRSSGRNPIDRAQVRAHRGLESRRTSSLVRGGVRLQVVEPAETWVDLGGLLDVEDLVVAGDWVARAAGTDAVLAEALGRRPGVRAARRLREALRWVRTGAESAGETRARLLFCRHGLPEPEVNGRVVAADGSGFLARSDFVWRRHRVLGEYQGAHHFGDFRRGDDDIARRLLLQDDGWAYVDMTRLDLSNPARRWGLLTRLARLLAVEEVASCPSPSWERGFGTISGPCVSAGRRR